MTNILTPHSPPTPTYTKMNNCCLKTIESANMWQISRPSNTLVNVWFQFQGNKKYAEPDINTEESKAI